MENKKEEKSFIGILLVVVIGLFGLGAVGVAISTGLKTVKVTNTVKTINRIGDAAELSNTLSRPSDNKPSLKAIKNASDVYSTMDAVNKISDVNEVANKSKGQARRAD